jgi:hypothetical protein
MAQSSIGNMTNTLIETGARHMQQCRTNYDVLLSLAGETEAELLNNPNKWGMAKDELAVSCNRNIFDDAPKLATKYAYPSVITCLGSFCADDTAKKKDPALFLAAYYHFMGQYSVATISKAIFDEGRENTTFDEIEDGVGNAQSLHVPAVAKQLRQFVPVGYSVTPACAHATTGDTVGSVQIGGLRTVMNGGFEVQTGDLIQMYLPDVESFLFNENGGRVSLGNPPITKAALAGRQGRAPKALDISTSRRRDFFSRINGIKGGPGGSDRLKEGSFSIKPYMETLNEEGRQYYGDKMRVFARALSSARPYEPVDIMIARQSL